MAIGEFELIKKYFNREELAPPLKGVMGIGDDCALIEIPDGMQLAQSLDTLVEGVHFPRHCDPALLAYRVLAVNLSDLAAMGAKPHSFTLGLTLPEANSDWLQGFSNGLTLLAQQAGIALIGGDTTRGPLTISVQVQGTVPKGKALKRSGAKVGDRIYVSGSLGDAAGALDFVLQNQIPITATHSDTRYLLERYYQPSPRLKLGQWLSQNGATSALDISDGLLGDLNHILSASGVGAALNLDAIPCSKALSNIYGDDKARQYALTGGDDYELCFTWPENKAISLPPSLGCTLSCIGKVTESKMVTDAKTGKPIQPEAFTHF